MKNGLIILSGGMDSVTLLHAEKERLAREVMEMLSEALDGKHQGMAIVMKGTHLCKSMRGVKSQGEMTVSVLTGLFKTDGEARREFYKLIDAQKR